ncbi:MAG: endonuclease/exonuclease/phosphatase family protein [Verrucomicrobiales bacterium]|nr:endonuclease/exonuclease/phosphatase family protein [Verrucomicrobiales bacterium]
MTRTAVVLAWLGAVLLSLTGSGCVVSRGVMPLGEVSSKAATEARSFSLVTWNVHKAKDEAFVQEVTGLLTGLPRDESVILCLQEVRSSTYQLIKESYAGQVSGHYTPSWRYPFSKSSTGVLSIANAGLLDARAQQMLAPGRELGFISPKVSLQSGLLLGGRKRVHLINAHGLNFVSKAVFVQQLQQIFAPLHSDQLPAMVAGDFNVWSEGRLRLLREKAKQAGLVEVVNRDPGKTPAPAWMGRLKGVGGYDPDLHLDRIFTRGLEVLDCYSIKKSQSSDHLPVVMRFKL